MIESVAWFARERFAAPEHRGLRLDWEYPLPLGAEAIATWNEHERALADKSKREWEAYQKAGGRWAAMHRSLAETGRPHYWEPADPHAARKLPAWFSPTVARPDAWLGLAGRRTTDAGTAWLLGLTELTLASDDLLYRQWKLAEPVVLMEAHARTRADLDALTAAVQPLLDWYTRKLLGKTFRTGGPPPLFTTQDQCRTAVVNAYRALLRSNPRPTKKLVAQRLNLSESGLRKALARFGLRWKDLVAEARAK